MERVSFGGPRPTTSTGFKDLGGFKNQIYYELRSVVTVIESEQ